MKKLKNYEINDCIQTQTMYRKKKSLKTNKNNSQMIVVRTLQNKRYYKDKEKCPKK